MVYPCHDMAVAMKQWRRVEEAQSLSCVVAAEGVGGGSNKRRRIEHVLLYLCCALLVAVGTTRKR